MAKIWYFSGEKLAATRTPGRTGTDTLEAKHHAEWQQFHLADWQVDAGSNRLRRGETEVKIESKLIAVLVHLAQHHGEMVTREQLEQAIWGKTVVGYDALTGCIARLRKVLGDNPRRPRYIETISKKGYRLIAPVSGGPRAAAPDTVTNIATPAAPGHHTRRRHIDRVVLAGLLLLAVLLAAGILRWLPDRAPAVSVADRPSIVVLPFSNLDNDPHQKYFSDGITADITTALAKLSGLFVVPHPATDEPRARTRDARQIADNYHVRYVLEGTIRRTDNRLRVNVSLIDAGRDTYLWSEKYDRTVRDVFAVQDDITANIVRALSVQLTEAEKRRTARKFTTRVEAYDDFLKGQSLYFRHTREDNRHARELYQQAIDRDPAFARAYSAMALTYVADYRYGWDRTAPGQLDRALQLARRGVSLDTELPQAHWVLGYVQVFRKEYDQAIDAATRAVQLDPNFADSYLTLAIGQIHSGRPEAALPLIRKAMLLNPGNPAAYSSILGQAYYFMGRPEEAVPVLREALEGNATLPTTHVFLIAALSELDRLDEATWAADEFRLIAPQFTANAVADMLPVQDPVTVEKMKNALRRVGL